MPEYPTPGPISASIDIAVGGVRIVAGDRRDTVVDVRPSDPSSKADVDVANATVVDLVDDRLRVKGPRPKLRAMLGRGTGGSVDVTIALPAGSAIDGTTQWGDIDGEGALGDCRVRSGLGHIRVEAARALSLKSGMGDVVVGRVAEADISTGSGDVRVTALSGRARIKNSNGDTWVGEAAGTVQLSAANGSIAVDRAAGDVGAKTAYGDIRLGAVSRGSVVAETAAGDIEVGIPEGTPAYLDVSATAGQVHNLLDAGGPPAGPRESVAVRARTTLGAITIRRAHS